MSRKNKKIKKANEKAQKLKAFQRRKDMIENPITKIYGLECQHCYHKGHVNTTRAKMKKMLKERCPKCGEKKIVKIELPQS